MYRRKLRRASPVLSRQTAHYIHTHARDSVPSVRVSSISQTATPPSKSVKLRHFPQNSLHPSRPLSRFDRMSRIHVLEISRSLPNHPNHPPIVRRPEKRPSPFHLLHHELPRLSASPSSPSSASYTPSSEDTEPLRFSGRRTPSNSPIPMRFSGAKSSADSPAGRLCFSGGRSSAGSPALLLCFSGQGFYAGSPAWRLCFSGEVSLLLGSLERRLADPASRVSGGGGNMNPAALSELSFIQIIQIYNEPWKYRKKVIK